MFVTYTAAYRAQELVQVVVHHDSKESNNYHAIKSVLVSLLLFRLSHMLVSH